MTGGLTTLPCQWISGKPAHPRNKSHFLFELSLLRQDGFYKVVKNEWRSVIAGSSPLERWQNKISHILRIFSVGGQIIVWGLQKRKRKVSSSNS
jgi:hypothetical protein